MGELLTGGLAVSTLVTLLFVFGFAPGAALRLLLRLYPKDHPRRQELLAEVYVVDRLERPFWVAEQLEVAISEGLTSRLRKTRDSLRSRLRRRIPRRVRRILPMATIPVLASGANTAVVLLTHSSTITYTSFTLWFVIWLGSLIWLKMEMNSTKTGDPQNVVVRPATAQAGVNAETPSVIVRPPSDAGRS